MKIERSTIAAGESQTLGFKSSFDKAAIKSLVASANAQGGTHDVVSGGVHQPDDDLSLIQARPGLKKIELVRVAEKPWRTIERWLQQLKAAGEIEFRGAPKTGGYHAKP